MLIKFEKAFSIQLIKPKRKRSNEKAKKLNNKTI